MSEFAPEIQPIVPNDVQENNDSGKNDSITLSEYSIDPTEFIKDYLESGAETGNSGK